jgi:hypothetical protein
MGDERNSFVKQVVAAVVIALLVGGTAPWWWSAISGDNDEPTNGRNGSIIDGPTHRCGDPTMSLSRGSGPSGTLVVVRGTGFPPDERVELRFHTELLPPARTDNEGSFEDEVVVPGTFDAFAGQQFMISATTKPTICTATAPFALTS